MTRDELLTRLLRLLPAQFDVVLFRTAIPPEYLASTNAPQATRAADAIRYLEQQNQLAGLAQVIEDVAPAGSAADRGRTPRTLPGPRLLRQRRRDRLHVGRATRGRAPSRAESPRATGAARTCRRGTRRSRR